MLKVAGLGQHARQRLLHWIIACNFSFVAHSPSPHHGYRWRWCRDVCRWFGGFQFKVKEEDEGEMLFCLYVRKCLCMHSYIHIYKKNYSSRPAAGLLFTSIIRNSYGCIVLPQLIKQPLQQHKQHKQWLSSCCLGCWRCLFDIVVVVAVCEGGYLILWQRENFDLKNALNVIKNH